MSALDDIVRQGYRRGIPRGQDRATIDIDREIAEEWTCPECGTEGETEYVPMTKDKVYRPYVRCVRCGWAKEF